MIRNPLCEPMIKLLWDTSHTTWNHVITIKSMMMNSNDLSTPWPLCPAVGDNWDSRVVAKYQFLHPFCYLISWSLESHPPIRCLQLSNVKAMLSSREETISFPLHQKTTRPTLQPNDQLRSLSQDGLGSLGSSSHGSSSYLRSIQRGLWCKGISEVGKKRRWRENLTKKNAKIWVVLEQIQITRIIFLYKFDCFRSTNCFQSTDFQISGCGYKCREHWKLGQLPKSLLNYLQWHCPKGNDKNCQDREHLSSLDHLRFWRSLIPDHSVRLRFTTSKLSSPPQGARLRDPKGNSDFFCEFQFDSFII